MSDTITAYVLPHDDADVRWQVNTEHELEDTFEDFVDQTHDDVVILGMTFTPGRLLRQADPTAFHEEFLRYAQGWAEVEVPLDIWFEGDTAVADWLDEQVASGVLSELPL